MSATETCDRDPFSSEPDGALALAYARGKDRGALGRLVERRWPDAVRVARAALGDPAAAEDAAQETFVRLVQGLARYDGERPFEAWFRSILANAIRDAARAGGARRRRERAVAEARGASAEPDHERRALAGEVAAEVCRLPIDVRTAIILHYYEGLGHDEVAAALGCPTGTASSRLRRGIEKLRAALAGSGRSLTAAGVLAALAVAASEARAESAAAPGGGAGARPPVELLEASAARAARNLAARGLAVKATAALASLATVGVVVALLATGPPASGDRPELVARGEREGAERPPLEAEADRARTPASRDADREDRTAGDAPAGAPAAATPEPALAETPPAVATVGDFRVELPAARDPLVERMVALTARARALLGDLDAECRARTVLLAPSAVAEIEGKQPAEAFRCLDFMVKTFEHLPGDPRDVRDLVLGDRRTRAEWGAAGSLMALARKQSAFRADAAGGAPRYALAFDELGEKRLLPSGDGGYTYSIVEATPDHFAMQAAPAAGEDRLTLWIDETAVVRADRDRVSAQSRTLADLVAERDARLAAIRPQPSAHDGRVRDLKAEAETLESDLFAAVKDLLFRSTIDPDEVREGLESRPAPDGLDTIAEVYSVYLELKRAAGTLPPEIVEARKGSNEAAAIGALRTLNTAQAIFREGDKDGNGVLDYAASLNALAAARLIDAKLASGEKKGYRYEIVGATETRWSATADPLQPGVSGDRSFFVDETGVIRFATTGTATAASVAIGG